MKLQAHVRPDPSMHAHPPELALDVLRLTAQQQRRRALLWLAGAGALPILGCGGGGDDAGTTTGGGFSSESCSVTPSETAGPYPGDGTNAVNGTTLNALSLSSIVRSDIRAGIPASLGTADGVPLTITLTLVNTNASCARLSGLAIYLWHCDRSGNYSMYSAGVTDQNHLRGVQLTDSSGQATFATIFPGCYSGRWPHVHLEIYPSLAAATNGVNDVKTSQLALAEAACREVYASTGYDASLNNLNAITLASDNVFSDGASLQTAIVTGSLAAGYVAALTVAIAA